VLYTRYTGAYKGDAGLFSKLFYKLYSFAGKNGLINQETKWFVVYHDYSGLTEEEKLRLMVLQVIPYKETDISGIKVPEWVARLPDL